MSSYVFPEAATRSFLLKRGFLKISIISLGKTCARAFFNKIADLRPAALLKKNLCVFSCDFCEIFKSIFFTEHLRRLFLFYEIS